MDQQINNRPFDQHLGESPESHCYRRGDQGLSWKLRPRFQSTPEYMHFSWQAKPLDTLINPRT